MHERYLRIVYSGETSSFENFLETDRSLAIHIRNLQISTRHIFKVSIKDHALTIFSERFSKRSVQPEAATGGVLWKKVFLNILQNSQENTCARVSF